MVIKWWVHFGWSILWIKWHFYIMHVWCVQIRFGQLYVNFTSKSCVSVVFVAWCMGCSSHFYFILFWIERLWLLENAEQLMEGHWVCLWSDLCDGMIIIIIIIKLRWALFVTYTIIQSITSSEMGSQHLTHPSAHTHLAQWAANTAAPGEQLGVRCLAQGSHLGLQVRRSIH